MSTLTSAELESYPGRDPAERFESHLAETRGPRSETPAELPAARPSPPKARPAALERVVDVRRFPGRDRVERVMNWLRASIPAADRWSEESSRDLARRLLDTAKIVE
jgi:hypothetical protein